MEFNEKTRWAINILIAYAVCASDELYCDKDCPLYKDAEWNDEDIVNAVKWLNDIKWINEWWDLRF